MENRDSNDSAGAFQRSNRHRVIASFGPRPRPRLPVGRCPFSFLLDATNDMLLPDKGNVPGYEISMCIYIMYIYIYQYNLYIDSYHLYMEINIILQIISYIYIHIG